MMYKKITHEEANKLIESKDVLVLDVRTEEEYITGHIKDAILIPLDELSSNLSKLKDKEKMILVYCKSGRRSKMACEILEFAGYTNVIDIGGVVGWKYGLEM